MRKFRVSVAVVVALGAALIAPQTHVAQASSSTFGILVYGLYCANGQPGCSTYNTAACQACPEAYQILAYGWGEPGKSSGRLSVVFAECDHYYTDASNVRHDDYEYAGYMSPSSGAGLVARGSESSGDSAGFMHFSTGVYGASGDSMTVTGSQIADNTADTNARSAINVHLTGTFYVNGTPSGSNTIDCSSAKMPPRTALNAENEFEPFDPAHPSSYAF